MTGPLWLRAVAVINDWVMAFENKNEVVIVFACK